MTYTYTSPKDKGYVQFKMNNYQHQLLYSKYRLNSIFRRNHYWINENSVYVENQLPTILFIILLTVGAPFVFLYYLFMIGIKGLPELFEAYKKDLYFSRKYGTFSSGTTWKRKIPAQSNHEAWVTGDTYHKIYDWLEESQPEVIAELKRRGQE